MKWRGRYLALDIKCVGYYDAAGYDDTVSGRKVNVWTAVRLVRLRASDHRRKKEEDVDI